MVVEEEVIQGVQPPSMWVEPFIQQKVVVAAIITRFEMQIISWEEPMAVGGKELISQPKAKTGAIFSGIALNQFTAAVVVAWRLMVVTQ